MECMSLIVMCLDFVCSLVRIKFLTILYIIDKTLVALYLCNGTLCSCLKLNVMKNLLTCFFVFISIFLFAQTQQSAKDMFWNAESFFYNKNYKEALMLYHNIYNNDNQNNANINYRIGVCYLKGYNKNSEKIKAVPYLEKAVTSTTKVYKEGDVDLTSAHEDAFIYLGDAYMINNDLDNAITAYNDYKTISEKQDSYYLSIVDRKIETCKSAKILESISVKCKLKNLGKTINNIYANYNAVMSADENMLVYTSDMLFYEAIMYSEKDENGEFSIPKNFNIDIQIEGSILSLCLSPDGTELYVFKPGALEQTGNIFVSKRIDGKWSKLLKLSINSSALERHASLSPDGNTLYFTSNRKGGYGSLDIYKTERTESGQWGKEVNLGEKINTKFDEITPFMLKDNKTLYFSSQGHTYNIGGADVFMSKIDEEGNWSSPLNFGFPLNTTGDDVFLFPLQEEGKAFISLATEDGFGDLDIYELTFYPQEKPMILIRGVLDNQEKEINIKITDENNNENNIKTDRSGKFEIEVPSGNIKIKFTADDMNDAYKEISVPLVYCLAPVDIGDIKLKHTKVLADTDTDKNTNTDTGTNPNEIKSNATVTTVETILFGFNKLIPDIYNKTLDGFANYLNSDDNILIEIQGYADLQGDDTYNIILSKRRANFVKDYLLKRGVAENKLIVKAFGEKNQISKDLNSESRKYNRRVTFKIVRDNLGKLKINSPNIPIQYSL